jgi:hypothetical protein
MGGPAAPPAGTGPVTAPGPQAGAAAQGMSGVRLALEAMQKALPGLPMGSELHMAVMKAVTDISKKLGDGGGDQAAQMQQLVQLARAAQTDPQRAAMMRAMPGPGGAPPGVAPMPGGGPQ